MKSWRTRLAHAALVFCLLWAQAALAAHGVAHAYGDEHEGDGRTPVCLECLALAGLQSAGVDTAPAAVPPAAPENFRVDSVSCASTFRFFHAFRSRAPPALQSR